MGYYVGEVLVQQAGVEWTVEEEKTKVFGSPRVLRIGHMQASPMARCFKRLESDSDGIKAWGRLLAVLASGNMPERRPTTTRRGQAAKAGVLADSLTETGFPESTAFTGTTCSPVTVAASVEHCCGFLLGPGVVSLTRLAR